MKTYTKAQIKEALHTGPITVSFTKVNGDTRIMECTLSADLLPTVTKVTEGADKKIPKPENESIVRVYDLKAQAWRSFKVDNVFDISTQIGIAI